MPEWEVYCEGCEEVVAGPFDAHFDAARASVKHRIDEHEDDPDTDIRKPDE